MNVFFKYFLIVLLIIPGCTNGIKIECPLKLGEPFCSWSKK